VPKILGGQLPGKIGNADTEKTLHNAASFLFLLTITRIYDTLLLQGQLLLTKSRSTVPIPNTDSSSCIARAIFYFGG
ncbi:MAG: hypothetical protein NC397_10040, partial [Clostridium sp.]|nr:hypothetical protein [Clostridium sp.]